MRCGQFALKKQKQCCAQEREVGDCWIGLSLADSSGLTRRRKSRALSVLREKGREMTHRELPNLY